MILSLSLLARLFFFGFTLWLGAYLAARHSSKAAVRLAGLGIMAYSFLLGMEILGGQIVPALALVPALLWIGAALTLIPEEIPWREALLRLWAFSAIPVFILTLLTPWAATLVVCALLGCAGMVAGLARKAYFRHTLALLAVMTVFLGLSTALVVLPFRFFSSFWGVLALGLDLLFLGALIVLWDAFDEGESLRLHLLRSFLAAFYYAGILAVLVFLAAAVEGGLRFGHLLLLVGVIAFGILTQTFAAPLQQWLDRAAFLQAPEMHRQRDMLYQAAEELPLISAVDPLGLPEEEFVRLTRRALSNLGDLPRLSVSPLVHLPQLADTPNPLERAQKLRALLAEHIERLRPQQPLPFGNTDEWRYYNAVYFPYVAGLKPYARQPANERLGEGERQALEWFQTCVPERTLHNWQNTAAQLLAKSLRSPS